MDICVDTSDLKFMFSAYIAKQLNSINMDKATAKDIADLAEKLNDNKLRRKSEIIFDRATYRNNILTSIINNITLIGTNISNVDKDKAFESILTAMDSLSTLDSF